MVVYNNNNTQLAERSRPATAQARTRCHRREVEWGMRRKYPLSQSSTGMVKSNNGLLRIAANMNILATNDSNNKINSTVSHI